MVASQPRRLISRHDSSSDHSPLRGGRTAVPVADITLAFTSVFAAVLLAFSAAFTAVPGVREWIAGRGGLLNWTSSTVLLIALGFGIWALRRSTDETAFRILIPTTAAVLLAQAFRFGSDLVGLRLPMVGKTEVGSLLDMRDVVAVIADQWELGSTTGAMVLLLLVLIAGWVALRGWHWARGRVRVTETLVVVYYVAAMACHAAIPVMGFFGESTGAWYATNVLAFGGAALLVIAGLAAADHRTTVAGWRRRMLPWLGQEQPLAGIGRPRG